MGIGSVIDYSKLWVDYVPPVIRVNPVNPNSQSPADDRFVSQNDNITPINRTNTPLEDISLTFNKEEDYGYIGLDRDVHTLDMDKAISDMEKDDLLKSYQYFVGNTATASVGGSTLIFASPDGLVYSKN